MKRLYYICCVLGILLVSSCDSLLNVNDDPARVSAEEATLPTLLPSAIRASATTMYGAAQYGNQYPQYLAGQAISQYTPYGFDQLWRPLYSEALPTLQDIIVRAEAAEAYNYSGIAKTLLGLLLMTATDVYGSIPYTQANQGTGNLYPCYDTMQELYEEHIISLLNEAIEDLQKPAPELAGLRVVQNDYIYAGDLEQWLKAAYAVRARYYLHLANRNPELLSNAIADAERSFTSNADDLALTYEEQNANPWFGFLGNATNKIMRPSSYLVDLLAGRSAFAVEDPRLTVYMTKTGTAEADGITPGELIGSNAQANVDVTASTWHASAEAPLEMITYAEMQFILAEAYYPTDKAAAYAAYLRGIEASLSKVGVAPEDIAAFMQSPEIAVGAENLTISDIMLQKYLALYLQIETWTDMRRYQYDPEVYIDLEKPIVNQIPGNPWIQRSNIADDEPGVNTCLPEVPDQGVTLWLFE
ncbi:SusD/RagB family nutrient-binding outer membrane lipoprotein [Cesiribacter sp. SM1]|uniref:SusD/RagB family nutrient-binding outer membrane lipoprotein n=1 Tax=Cesiribacter sp. SM1 TaxID=2861196 RepID=UPI001CD2CE10|nr:SusD/RagB family nutrient-binding outer membrane lipoprotein [Cesiribacter sp. SM1]